MIDFHCHLDLYPDPHAIARACVDRDLYILSVTTTPSAWLGTTQLATNAARIRTALGLHPQIAHQRKGELPLFERLLEGARYVGEVGLDGTPDSKAHWDDQIAVFLRILDMCSNAGGRVLSVHSRRAVTAVLDAIEAQPNVGTPILHWFSGTQRELARAIDLGCWFSVGPGMLRGSKGRELASRMPRNRVLTESDGPFAQIDGRSAWPWEAAIAEPDLGRLWQLSISDTRAQLARNLTYLAS